MKINAGTVARTIVLVLALINQILAIIGKDMIDITESDIYQLCTLVATVTTSLIAWWKNNSFTEAAKLADCYMKAIKEDGLPEEVEEDA